jgi:hypothetical protein
VKFDYFRDIVDIIPWGVGIETGGEIVLSLVDLGHKFLKGIANFVERLFIEFGLLETLNSFFFLVLEEGPLLLTLLIDVATEIVDFAL